MFRRINSIEPQMDNLAAATRKAKEHKKSDEALKLLQKYQEALRTGNRQDFDSSYLEFVREYGL